MIGELDKPTAFFFSAHATSESALIPTPSAFWTCLIHLDILLMVGVNIT